MKNTNKLYIVKLDISDDILGIPKIGCAKGDVEKRFDTMRKETGRNVELVHAWDFGMDKVWNGLAFKNYAIEQQAHHYLRNEQFPMVDYFPTFGGKSELFDISINKAYSAVANAIRWVETNPAPLKAGYVIANSGYIKYYRYLNRSEK